MVTIDLKATDYSAASRSTKDGSDGASSKAPSDVLNSDLLIQKVSLPSPSRFSIKMPTSKIMAEMSEIDHY